MYHGGNPTAPHEGMCLTDNLFSAVGYAEKNAACTVLEIEVDWDAVTVGAGEGFEHDGNGTWSAPSDTDLTSDTDIIEFDDQGMNFEAHTTWRLMTAAAVAATRIVAVHEVDDLEGAY